MSRTLHADVVSALASGAYRYVNLVQIQWDSADGGTDYLTDAQFDITDGSDTYTAKIVTGKHSDMPQKLMH